MHMHIIQRKQFSETNKTSQTFQQISNFSWMLSRVAENAVAGTCGPWACIWTTLV